MRGRRGWPQLLAGLWPLPLLAPALAQGLPPLPQLPPAPGLFGALADCVPRYGHTGCAARLYARLLCDSLGSSTTPELMQAELEQQYEQAAIDFGGITAEQVETAAVRYYAPSLCPERSPQIRQLFDPS